MSVGDLLEMKETHGEVDWVIVIDTDREVNFRHFTALIRSFLEYNLPPVLPRLDQEIFVDCGLWNDHSQWQTDRPTDRSYLMSKREKMMQVGLDLSKRSRVSLSGETDSATLKRIKFELIYFVVFNCRPSILPRFYRAFGYSISARRLYWNLNPRSSTQWRDVSILKL